MYFSKRKFIFFRCGNVFLCISQCENAFVAVEGEATVQAARESERVLTAKLSAAAALAPFPQRNARKAHKLEKLDFLLFPFRKVFVN